MTLEHYEYTCAKLSKKLTIIDLHLKCCGDNKIDIDNKIDGGAWGDTGC